MKMNLLKALVLLIYFFSSCYAVLAQTVSLSSRVHEYTLKNGLTVLLMERHQSPTVSLYLRFKVGSVDEIRGSTGAAHLLEHMLFKGTKTLGTKDYSKENKILTRIDTIGEQLDRELRLKEKGDSKKTVHFKKELQRLEKKRMKLEIIDEIDTIYSRNGAVDFNASTGNDVTTYQVSLPANRIELWARIESDRFSNPVFRGFYAERDVVLEELRQSYETNPERVFMSRFLSSAFIAHPYGTPIIGWKSDIELLSKIELCRFFTTHYVPNNAVISIVGDINIDYTLKLIDRYFSAISSKPLSPPVITEEPEQLGKRQIEVVLDAEPRILIGYHKPTLPSFEDYVFDVIDKLLSSGRTSRLYKKLIDDKKIATRVSTINGLPGARYPNLFVIEALPRPTSTCSEVTSAIYEEIERLKQVPVTAYELQKIKNQLKADFIRGLQSNDGLANQLSYFEVVCDDWRYIEKHGEMIDKITPADIQKTAKLYFTPENCTIARLVKKPSSEQQD